ncbi:indolepyruvate ferredoxin oxidoreductase subunit alpha [Blautia ammoniilytica]|uniref:Indolepyruvate oxidoreductase subunit IorA n=1 Tax=Blautia ammoniilytica TaxID=2981782 RepID=A0ABT2TS65_9FIRM|nr:indolepyruvate ferredoxin oxidoreductase subunit alpha [Blautia ammoniilytica]MCU6765093.1 indolepyruvate ferredoxin oxidoreductase subunit alpha [Blautia ammoniilytica]SCH83650.1 Ferredoxin II [uncultured Blautia sp.]
MKKLMTGDEAIARGAYEAGVSYASAYPGTPSTEILENLSTYKEIYAEWAPNEKVAMESAIGASVAGLRSIVSMKHVGMNVAADPMFTWAYMGVNGGNVIVTADEPGMFSSQNEQDNRNYAKAAKIAMMEPSDSQECIDMVKAAYDLGEEFDTPFIIRMTTRVCHSKSIVELTDRAEQQPKTWEKNPAKYVCLPAIARKLRVNLEKRMEKLAAYSETTPFNRMEMGDTRVGVIASGICYYYAKEVFGEEASYLKLGFTNPLPAGLIKDFCSKVDKVYILEENDPYIEEFVKQQGCACIGKELFPSYGELTPDVIRACITGKENQVMDFDHSKLIGRAPSFCAGCPHRGLFYRLGKHKDIMISGDIGCYTLAAAKPYSAMDSTVCMGASISLGHGAQRAFNMEGVNRRVVTVLGDSTFFHTGINSLINTVYNKSNTVNIILDNRITGMTGHQNNPGTGYTAKGEETTLIRIENLVRAIGMKHVYVINPNNLQEVDDTLDKCLALDEPSVIITRWPCALKKFSKEDKAEFDSLFVTKNKVDEEKCVGCRLCLKAGCPAMSYDRKSKKVHINKAQCVGCDVCTQVCPKAAIVKEEA